MKSAAARRVPRKIGQDHDEEPHGNGSAPVHGENGSVVKRPVRASRSKFTQSSSLRTSFAALEESHDEMEVPSDTPKPQHSQRSLERTAQLRASTSDAPSNYLMEPEDSTASTPGNLDNNKSASIDSSQPLRLDISSKFGDSALTLALSTQEPQSRIPSDAEIREKKERRRRLAKESDYISLNDDNNDSGDMHAEDSENEDPRSRSLVIAAEEAEIPSKYGETRLVHEDEDMAEGFDEFVEDQGKVALGRKAAKEQERRRKIEIEDQIKSAQRGYGHVAEREPLGDSDSEEAEEAARNTAYDNAQTRAGAYGISTNLWKDMDKEEKLKRRLELPKMRALPDFKAVVARFSDILSAKEREIEENKKRLVRVRHEREEIETDEIRVKELLSEAGVKYARLTEEAVAPHVEVGSESSERGVESFAGMRQLSPPDAWQDYNGLDHRLDSSLNTASTDPNETIGSRASLGMARIPTEEDQYSD